MYDYNGHNFPKREYTRLEREESTFNMLTLGFIALCIIGLLVPLVLGFASLFVETETCYQRGGELNSQQACVDTEGNPL